MVGDRAGPGRGGAVQSQLDTPEEIGVHRGELLNEQKHTSPALHIKAMKCSHSKISKGNVDFCENIYYIAVATLAATWVKVILWAKCLVHKILYFQCSSTDFSTLACTHAAYLEGLQMSFKASFLIKVSNVIFVLTNVLLVFPVQHGIH